MWADVRQALTIVWLIVAGLCGLVLLASVVAPVQLAGAFPACQARAAGGSCSFCGMTTAFVMLGRGDLDGARVSNAGSLPLFTGMLLNFVAGVTYTMMRVKRHANS